MMVAALDRYFLLAVMSAVLSHPTATFAQHGQDAAVIGTVRDASGAIVKGAAVTVSSAQLLGGPQSAAADDKGVYHIVFLPPGDYEMRAALTGFNSAIRESVTLRPGLTFTVDFTLQPAGIAETIDVHTPLPTIDVRASSAPVLIDRQLLENLPLPRTPGSGLGTAADAVNLVPGVVQSVALGGTFLSNPLSIDGTNGNEPGFGTPTLYPNLNWFQELQVVSVGADAQYGEYTGALVNAITRSGSNRFSGMADYWTTRPDWTGNNRGSLTPQLQDRFLPLKVADRWDADVQVGGPIARDRFWFFAGAESYRDAYWPAAFGAGPTSADPKHDENDRKFIAKLTAALTTRVRAEGFVEHAADNVAGANAAPVFAPDALAVTTRPETAWSTRLLWTIGSRAVVELRNSGHDFSSFYGPPDGQRDGPPAHFDQLTGVWSQNVPGISTWHDRPIATTARFTYFADGFSGAHQLAFGVEYEHASLTASDAYVGGRLYYDVGGQPSEVELWDGAINRPVQSRRTVYAQDAWSVTDRLTVNAGVRAGIYRGSVPSHPDAFANHSISPRVGAALDVTGDHSTVLRIHYGRYYDELVTSFYDFLDPLSHSPFIRAAVVGPNEFVEEFRLPTTAQASIDPRAVFPFVEEYVAAGERQLPGGISARAQYVWRDFKDAIGFIDPARTWAPVQAIDPGPDGKRGTADDGGPITVYYDQDPNQSSLLLTNPAAAYRRYRGAQFMLSKRYSRRTEFQASYTWSRTVGSYNNQAFTNAANNDLGTNGVFVNPNRLINTEGRTPQDFTHDVKLIGTYQLERWGGVAVSGIYRYQSGRPWARSANFGVQTEAGVIFVEPRGSRELPPVDSLDLRVEKTWKPSSKTGTAGAFVDIFNAGNQGVALRIVNSSGPNLGVPSSWIDPRTVRAGLRLMF